jgi:cbb3-type cytochrome oxidase subunit 3
LHAAFAWGLLGLSIFVAVLPFAFAEAAQSIVALASRCLLPGERGSIIAGSLPTGSPTGFASDAVPLLFPLGSPLGLVLL